MQEINNLKEENEKNLEVYSTENRKRKQEEQRMIETMKAEEQKRINELKEKWLLEQ